MSYPEFFAAVPRLTLRDPLAELLGAAENGLIEYGYTDAVKLAGHSCPTVAGAYLMTFRALAKLYPGCPPSAAPSGSNCTPRRRTAPPVSLPLWPACSPARRVKGDSRE